MENVCNRCFREGLKNRKKTSGLLPNWGRSQRTKLRFRKGTSLGVLDCIFFHHWSPIGRPYFLLGSRPRPIYIYVLYTPTHTWAMGQYQIHGPISNTWPNINGHWPISNTWANIMAHQLGWIREAYICQLCSLFKHFSKGGNPFLKNKL